MARLRRVYGEIVDSEVLAALDLLRRFRGERQRRTMARAGAALVSGWARAKATS